MQNLLLICGAAGCCLAAFANPVRNPGFEEELKGWGTSVTSKAPSALTAADDAYAGKRALKVKFDSVPVAGVYSTLWQKVPVRAVKPLPAAVHAEGGEGDAPVVFGGGPGWKTQADDRSRAVRLEGIFLRI